MAESQILAQTFIELLRQDCWSSIRCLQHRLEDLPVPCVSGGYVVIDLLRDTFEPCSRFPNRRSVVSKRVQIVL